LINCASTPRRAAQGPIPGWLTGGLLLMILHARPLMCSSDYYGAHRQTYCSRSPAPCRLGAYSEKTDFGIAAPTPHKNNVWAITGRTGHTLYLVTCAAPSAGQSQAD
jgi:hypothetical protein